MKRTAVFAVFILAACSNTSAPSEQAVDPHDAVHLAFEGDLKNLGWAGVTPTAESKKAKFRRGPTGKALYPLGDGTWIEYRTTKKLALGDRVSISFDYKPEKWENPYGPGSATKTIVVVSGRRPDRIQHVAFAISNGAAPIFQAQFEDADKESHRLTAEPGMASSDWNSVRLDIDRAANATQLYLNGALVASVDAVPAAIENGIDVLKFGTWYKKNQAYRGYIDNFVIADLSDE